MKYKSKQRDAAWPHKMNHAIKRNQNGATGQQDGDWERGLAK